MTPRPEQKRKIANDVKRGATPFIPSTMPKEQYEELLRSLRAERTPEQVEEAKAIWDEFIEATDGKAKLEKRAKDARDAAAAKKNIPIKKPLSDKDPRSRVPSGWDTAQQKEMNRPLYRGKQSEQVIVDEVSKGVPWPEPSKPPANTPKANGMPWDEQAKWEAVMQVWEDCKTLDYDEEDIGEMLYDVISSIVNGTYEVVTGIE